MARKPFKKNEISVKWLDSQDKGKINRINVKHVEDDLRDARKGTEVTVKLSSRRYRAEIVNFLDWQPMKRRRETKTDRIGQSNTRKETKSKETKSKPQTTSGRKNNKTTVSKPFFLKSGTPLKRKETKADNVGEDKGKEKEFQDLLGTNEESHRVVLEDITNTPQSPSTSRCEDFQFSPELFSTPQPALDLSLSPMSSLICLPYTYYAYI